MSDGEYGISINVFTADPSEVARACEVLGRAVAGLALDGIDSSMHVHELGDADD